MIVQSFLVEARELCRCPLAHHDIQGAFQLSILWHFWPTSSTPMHRLVMVPTARPLHRIWKNLQAGNHRLP